MKECKQVGTCDGGPSTGKPGSRTGHKFLRECKQAGACDRGPSTGKPGSHTGHKFLVIITAQAWPEGAGACMNSFTEVEKGGGEAPSARGVAEGDGGVVGVAPGSVSVRAVVGCATSRCKVRRGRLRRILRFAGS